MTHKLPSQMTLYGIAAGVLLLGGTIVSVKRTLFPAPLASCTTRYGGGIDFPSQFASAGNPIDPREVQSRLGFDEWGFAENVKLTAAQVGPFGTVVEVALAGSDQKGKSKKGGVGYSWKPGIPNGASAACLSYGVRMPPTFDYDKGGTLPGIFGGEEPRAGKSGFAARIAWGANGIGDIVANLPGAGERGVSLAPGSWKFPVGEWVLIEQEVRLNTPGRADGMVAIWIDGELHAELHNVAFRNHAQVRIDGVLSDVHYAGNPTGDSSIQITNFNLRWQ